MSTLDTLDHKKYGLFLYLATEEHYATYAASLQEALKCLVDALEDVKIQPLEVIDGSKSHNIILVKLASKEVFQIRRIYKSANCEISPIHPDIFNKVVKKIKGECNKLSLKAQAKGILESNGFSPEDIKTILNT